MKNKHTVFEMETGKTYDFIDLTDRIKEFVEKSKIKNGLVNIQSLHTSSSIVLNECDEPLLRKDLKNFLEKLAPMDEKYHHDNFDIRTVNICPEDECVNGHAHCKALLLPSTITLNLIDGALQLGRYQKIFFIELDQARSRKVQVHIIGE